MKKNICFFLFKTFLPAACLVSAVLFVMHPVSCRATVEGLSFLEGDFTVPSIKSLEICSSKGRTRCRLRIDTCCVVNKISVKPALFYLFNAEISGELIEYG